MTSPKLLTSDLVNLLFDNNLLRLWRTGVDDDLYLAEEDGSVDIILLYLMFSNTLYNIHQLYSVPPLLQLSFLFKEESDHALNKDVMWPCGKITEHLVVYIQSLILSTLSWSIPNYMMSSLNSSRRFPRTWAIWRSKSCCSFMYNHTTHLLPDMGTLTFYFHQFKPMSFEDGCTRWEMIFKSNGKQCLVRKLTVGLCNFNFNINFDTVDCQKTTIVNESSCTCQ